MVITKYMDMEGNGRRIVLLRHYAKFSIYVILFGRTRAWVHSAANRN
jgi:hypothetical protein